MGTTFQNSKKMMAISVLLLLGLLVSACSGTMPTNTWPGLVAENGVVYVTSQGLLLAIQEGGELWRFPEKADPARMIHSPPAIKDGKIYVGDIANNIYAIDEVSGAQTWVYSDQKGKGGIVGGLKVVEGTVLAPSTDHYLYALDLNGALKWKFKARNILWTTPIVDDKTVYLSGMDHYLYAINLTSGKLVWETDLGSAIMAIPILNEGNLIVATLGKELVSVNADSGKLIWRTPLEGSAWSHPLLQEGTYYFGTDTGKVYAVSAAYGKVQWQKDAGSSVLGTPALFGDGFAVTTENGEVHLFSFAGDRPWSRQLKGKLYTSPVVVNERLVIAGVGTDTVLTTYDANGTTSWTFNPAK